MYSAQEKETCVGMPKKELRLLLGMYLKMVIVQMPGNRIYWESETKYSLVINVMSGNRSQSLLTNFYFVNNLKFPDEERNQDTLWKLLPWLEEFRKQCLLIEPEKNSSVDEMMDTFKGSIMASSNI